MSATTNFNNMTAVHKSSNGISICFPDVCKTPTPVGPIPIPYPNIAMSKDTSQGSKKVKVDGNPIMLKTSVYSTSTGDEAGSVGGVVSNVTKGNAEFMNYSFDVKVEGKNVCRLLDPMAQNKAPCTGNGVGPANLQPPVVAMNPGLKAKAKKTLTATLEEVKFESGIPLWTTNRATKKDEELPPSGEPHWKRGGKKYPAVYVRDGAKGSPKRDLKVTLKISTDLSGEAKLSGESGTTKLEGKKSVSPGDDQKIVFDCKFTKLPDTVALLRKRIFKWKLTLSGQTRWLGTNVNTLYIVDEQPKPVTWPGGENKEWYDWVLDYSCDWADGVTGETKVFDAIWSRFSRAETARVPHDTGWVYWKTGDASKLAQKLQQCPYTANKKGWSCRAICHFFMMAVAAHGHDIESVVPKTNGKLGFVVATWKLSGKGGQPEIVKIGGGPGLYYGGEWDPYFATPKQHKSRKGWTLDASRNAAVGQGQSNPPLLFGNHWIVEYKNHLYDTSYGITKVTKGASLLTNYEKKAVSGWQVSHRGRPFVIGEMGFGGHHLISAGSDAST